MDEDENIIIVILDKPFMGIYYALAGIVTVEEESSYPQTHLWNRKGSAINMLDLTSVIPLNGSLVASDLCFKSVSIPILHVAGFISPTSDISEKVTLLEKNKRAALELRK